MRRLIAPMVLGLAILGSPVVPAASALDHVTWDCNFGTIAQEDLTGGQDTFTGVMYGYAVSSTPTDSVEIICYVQINGNPPAPPPAGTACPDGSNAGTGPSMGADTYGPCQVTYTASDTDNVQLCGVVYVNGQHHDDDCFETTTTQIPPQEVIDAINELFDLIAELTAPLDPIICDVIQAAGLPGIINSATSMTGIWVDPDDCDIWIICPPERIIDFVPYNDPYNGPPCP